MELLMQLAMLLTPVIGGKLTELATDLLKKIGGFLHGTSAWVKQAVALVVAAGLAYAATFLNAPQIVEGDPGTIVNAVLAFILAMLFHNGRKAAGEKPA